jgi:hypothetical protein
MLIQIFVALAKHGEEASILGVGTNRRLVEIQKDSFIMREDHRIGYETKINTYNLNVGWEENDDISKEKEVSDKRKEIHAEVSGKDENEIAKGDLVV